MTVRYHVFESSSQSWEEMCEEVAQFATEKGRQNVINISVAASGGTEMFGHAGRGVIVVWYWE